MIPDTVLPAQAVPLADALFRSGRPFHAHEVLEAAWKSGPDAERDLWQGLAQIAVGVTHAHRGNSRGAITLLRRGVARVRSYQGETYGVDLPGVLTAASSLADRIERDGLGAVPASLLRPRLLAGT